MQFVKKINSRIEIRQRIAQLGLHITPLLKLTLFSAVSAKKLTITRSESFNHHNSYTPNKAHDGNYDTLYSVEDNKVAGNFLKLYLTETSSIWDVIVVGRNQFLQRMNNTEVIVYSTVDGETEVANCGKITGNSEL